MELKFFQMCSIDFLATDQGLIGVHVPDLSGYLNEDGFVEFVGDEEEDLVDSIVDSIFKATDRAEVSDKEVNLIRKMFNRLNVYSAALDAIIELCTHFESLEESDRDYTDVQFWFHLDK
ncbi:hypothetical protein [Chroococcidiopsis sp.]|uniref:hypothetical protein n=1 Tax=Chroococcidiopsis sp. TaxID=3088168 RepID=UPI003F3A3AF2